MANEYLPNIYRMIEQGSKEIEAVLKPLNLQQLNWKENTTSWSVGECVHHIMTTNRSYFATFDRLTGGSYVPSTWTKLPRLWHTFWGKVVLQMVAPKLRSRSKSPQVFQPTLGSHPLSILEDFKKHQRELTRKLHQLPGRPHDRIIISSPASQKLTYSLQHAVEIIANHELRHANQCRGIISHLSFPRGGGKQS
ncbi:MAG: DinB family protein [Saprospiraceae bacterium]|nr:DinB family protein [Saprospiraceae bacterium]